MRACVCVRDSLFGLLLIVGVDCPSSFDVPIFFVLIEPPNKGHRACCAHVLAENSIIGTSAAGVALASSLSQLTAIRVLDLSGTLRVWQMQRVRGGHDGLIRPQTTPSSATVLA